MRKFKRLCSKISKEHEKLYVALIIGYVILIILKYFGVISSTFACNSVIWSYVIYDMFRDLNEYDTETIMENNFLYIILSIHSPILFIICYSILYVGIKFFNIDIILSWSSFIFGLIDIVISIVLTTKINRYFKKKIKINDNTSN